mmetsp:Transcript_20558/g.51872  ORF Transcript_20558/g.51872 Transcript_20558/m.51872 type:complete len:317 (-) Transcript_20558:182-1132(-)
MLAEEQSWAGALSRRMCTLPCISGERGVTPESEFEAMCICCLDMPADVMLLPCRHTVLCIECHSKLANQPCPMCRGRVAIIERVSLRGRLVDAARKSYKRLHPVLEPVGTRIWTYALKPVGIGLFVVVALPFVILWGTVRLPYVFWRDVLSPAWHDRRKRRELARAALIWLKDHPHVSAIVMLISIPFVVVGWVLAGPPVLLYSFLLEPMWRRRAEIADWIKDVVLWAPRAVARRVSDAYMSWKPQGFLEDMPKSAEEEEAQLLAALSASATEADATSRGSEDSWPMLAYFCSGMAGMVASVYAVFPSVSTSESST